MMTIMRMRSAILTIAYCISKQYLLSSLAHIEAVNDNLTLVKSMSITPSIS
jgi:hypothetical protein